jgi:hypothetical protein
LFNDIVSPIVAHMFNGLEHTAILSIFLAFITGSSSRLLRIRISAALSPVLVSGPSFPVPLFDPSFEKVWIRPLSTLENNYRSIYLR